MNVTNSSIGGAVIENGSVGGASFLTHEIQLTLTFILVLIVVVGIAGNIMLMAMLLHTKAFRANATSVFVLNLSCADLLFLIFCVPFQGTVYVLNNWPYGYIPCKTTHFFQYTAMFASVWLLMVMSIDRYFALKHPLKAVAFRTPRMAARYSVAVWLLACLVSIPWLFLYNTITFLDQDDQGQVTACLDIWPMETFFLRKWLMLFIFIASFAFPTLTVIIMGWLVASSLWTSSSRWNLIRSRNSQKTFRQRRLVALLVFCLALLLFVCWLPHNISLMWINFGEIKAWGRDFFIYKVTAHMLSYLNSCINPCICFFMSRGLQPTGSAGETFRSLVNARWSESVLTMTM
uniref:G_PROTEIN_RECEP_F1_2 domain-containing protein n=1 Tax=Trichuris muris TaxID=70415 RepID=A0A5S6QRH1_TRIMR